jgi:serine O-acetyltransferase
MSYNNYHTKNIIGLSLFHYRLYKAGHFLYLKKEILLFKVLKYLLKFPYKCTSLLLNCHVPFSVSIGENLVLPHGFFGIFISKDTKIGNNVLIFHQVTIGSNRHTADDFGSPIIGDNVFIGVGSKIIGKIIIGNNVKVGANAIVVNNISDNKTFVSQKGVLL